MNQNSESQYILSSKASIISFGTFAISFSHLIAAVVLSYTISKAEYGAFRQVWLIYRTMIPILTLGLPYSINYFIPQMKTPHQKAINLQTYLILAVSGFILSLLFFFGAPLIGIWFNNPSLKGLLQIFSLVPLLTFPTLYYQNLFVCLNKAVLATKLSLLMALGYFVSITIPVLLGYSVKEIFISFTAYSLIQLILVSILIFRPFNTIKIQWTKPLIRKQLKYAIPIGLAAVVGILNRQLDKFVISSMFSVSQFATYVNGAFEIPLIGILTGSVTAVLMPEFVKLWHDQNRDDLMKIWHSAIRKVALILYPVMFFQIAYAPEIMTVLFSYKYLDSAVIFRIYSLALLVRITNFGMVLLSLGLSAIVLRYSILTFLLNIVLNIFLLKTIGFAGPAIATVIVIFSMNFLQLKRIGSEIKIPMRDIFPWIKLLHLFLLSFLTAASVYFIKGIFPFKGNLLILLQGGVLFCVFFLILGLALKILTRQDILMPVHIIRGIMKNK